MKINLFNFNWLQVFAVYNKYFIFLLYLCEISEDEKFLVNCVHIVNSQFFFFFLNIIMY